ncbi:hypothetical protein CPB85DRAFT_1337751 [Mucidula mucida]|nr:hypothetical protein CPB85DRAFT_1337751 [Mucidula mucida]
MALPSTHGAAGEPVSTKNQLLERPFRFHLIHHVVLRPLKGICAHLNAFHVYASDPTAAEDVRQCLIYDSHEPTARLIGIEYMVTPRLYATLPPEERKLWHSHKYEVKSGMLVMPAPQLVPDAAWEIAETKEMEQVIGLYGKTYHLWQTDRGDTVPMGEPQLMMSFTSSNQCGAVKNQWAERDSRFGVDGQRKADKRADIPDPSIHEDADSMWQKPEVATV